MDAVGKIQLPTRTAAPPRAQRAAPETALVAQARGQKPREDRESSADRDQVSQPARKASVGTGRRASRSGRITAAMRRTMRACFDRTATYAGSERQQKWGSGNCSIGAGDELSLGLEPGRDRSATRLHQRAGIGIVPRGPQAVDVKDTDSLSEVSGIRAQLAQQLARCRQCAGRRRDGECGRPEDARFPRCGGLRCGSGLRRVPCRKRVRDASSPSSPSQTRK